MFSMPDRKVAFVIVIPTSPLFCPADRSPCLTRKPDKWNPGQNHFSDYATTQELATRLKNGQDVGVSSTERQPSLMMIFLVFA
jgi:hypothetical protein